MNSKLLKFTIFCLFWHQILSASPGTSEEPIKDEPKSPVAQVVSRDEALKLYQNKEFTQSIGVITKLIEKEGDSPDLYYNLFINHYSLDQIGEGLFSLRKSLELKPNYTESLFALSNLKKSWETRFFMKRNFFDKFFIQLHYYIDINSLLWIFLISLGLSYRVAIKLYKDHSSDKDLGSGKLGLLGISLSLLVFVGASLAAKSLLQLQSRATSIAVTSAKVTPSDSSPEIMTLKEGEEVIVKENKDIWVRVEDHQGKQAWVLKDQIKLSTKDN